MLLYFLKHKILRLGEGPKIDNVKKNYKISIVLNLFSVLQMRSITLKTRLINPS